MIGHALLHVQPVEVGEGDVEHQAARHVGGRPREKLVRRRVRLRPPAFEADQQLQRFTNRDVVVDNENDRVVCCIEVTWLRERGRPPRNRSMRDRYAGGPRPKKAAPAASV
jgi:hypothetical protein